VSKNLEDVFVWPDGSWCYRCEIHEYRWISDDYSVVEYRSEEYKEFFMKKLKGNQ